MRKLIVCNMMSLDGYYEGPGKNVMVLPMDQAFDSYNAERLRAADTLEAFLRDLRARYPALGTLPASRQRAATDDRTVQAR